MKLVMSEGKEIEPHFESHAIVALVVGELNEGENLLDSREKTLVFSGRSRRWRFAPFYEQLFQAGIGFCGSAWRLVLSMERKRVDGYDNQVYNGLGGNGLGGRNLRIMSIILSTWYNIRLSVIIR